MKPFYLACVVCLFHALLTTSVRGDVLWNQVNTPMSYTTDNRLDLSTKMTLGEGESYSIAIRMTGAAATGTTKNFSTASGLLGVYDDAGERYSVKSSAQGNLKFNGTGENPQTLAYNTDPASEITDIMLFQYTLGSFSAYLNGEMLSSVTLDSGYIKELYFNGAIDEYLSNMELFVGSGTVADVADTDTYGLDRVGDAIPEPTSGLLLLIGAATLMLKRKRI